METQLKKGLLEALVLSILKKGDTYGYKLFDEVTSIIDIATSTLYPILKRLEQQNVLHSYQEQYMGRLRNYYKLTEEGLLRLSEYQQMCQETIKIMEVIMEGKNES